MSWKHSYLAIDTETSSLLQKERCVFALAGVPFKDGTETEGRQVFFFNPDLQIDQKVIDGNRGLLEEHSSQGVLDKMPYFQDCLLDISRLLTSSNVWVTHGMPFDLSALDRDFTLSGGSLAQLMLDHEILALDTRVLSAYFLFLQNKAKQPPRDRPLSLANCLARWHVSLPNQTGDVLDSARASGRLLAAMLGDLPDDRAAMASLFEEACAYTNRQYPVRGLRNPWTPA